MNESTSTKGQHVVIVGGGIVGCASAYYLTKLDNTCRVTIIERHKIAGSASGKAGGFLAGNWGSNKTDEFHKKGYKLIEELADELKVDSYRKLKTWQLSWNSRTKKTAVRDCKWLHGRVTDFVIMDPDTAQITPYDFTNRMLEAAVETKQCEVVIGECTGVVHNEKNTSVKAVIVDGKEITLDKLLMAIGPWSVMCEKWFPGFVVPISGIWSTSLAFKPNEEVEAASIFCGEDENGCHLEIISRPNNEVHICGCGGSKTLSGSDLIGTAPEKVLANPNRVEAALKSFNEISCLEVNKEELTMQACMRPFTEDGLPMIGPIPKTSNAFVAAGHNCWGILWSAITGKVMAELMLTGKPQTASIKNFSPARFSKFRS